MGSGCGLLMGLFVIYGNYLNRDINNIQKQLLLALFQITHTKHITTQTIDMKALFYFILILLALTLPDKYGAMWVAIMVGTIMGLLRYNLKNKEL